MDVASYAGCHRDCTVTLPLCRLPSAATVRSILRLSGHRSSGSASRHFTRHGGQPRVGRASTRSFRCCRSRGRRRKAECVGDDGVGARNIVANRAGRSSLRWRAVRTTLARTCWVSALRAQQQADRAGQDAAQGHYEFVLEQRPEAGPSDDELRIARGPGPAGGEQLFLDGGLAAIVGDAAGRVGRRFRIGQEDLLCPRAAYPFCRRGGPARARDVD